MLKNVFFCQGSFIEGSFNVLRAMELALRLERRLQLPKGSVFEIVKGIVAMRLRAIGLASAMHAASQRKKANVESYSMGLQALSPLEISFPCPKYGLQQPRSAVPLQSPRPSTF